MTAQVWLFIFIGLIILNFAFSSILEYINDKNWKNEIPTELKDFYNKKKYLKAKDYKKSRGKVSLVSSVLSTTLTLFILSTGIYGYVSDFIYEINNSTFIHSATFFLFFYIINMIISIPISYYSTFVIEERFGFNKTTLKTFCIDLVKGTLMSLIIGGLLLGAALFIYDYFSDGFWIWLWIGLGGLMMLINMFYADVIVPIFNKLTPLEEGSLREKIENYSKKVGYSLKNIYIIDGSKRSTKANAFFSGLGPRKTIALYDTLIEKHTEPELVAVLAHEVGHYKKKHIFNSMLLTILQLGLMCFLLEMCIKNPMVSKALGGSGVVFHLGLLAFSILYSPVATLIGLFMNVLSRKNEYEADEYAKTTYDGEALQLALKKLSVDSLSNLYPHPWYVFMHYSHPPLLKRLEALSK